MTLTFNPGLREAASDALLASWGSAPRNPHPQVADFGDKPLSMLARICANAQRQPAGRAPSDSGVVASGMMSSDFSATVAGAAQAFARNRFAAGAAHRAFCVRREASDFMPIEVTDLSISTELAKITENGELTAGRVLMSDGHSEAQLISYGKTILYSREIVVNERSEMVATTLAALGASGARTEAKQVYALLESNPVMADGGNAFDAVYGNIVAEALTAGSLGAATVALRNGVELLRAEGDYADLIAAHLVVAAGLEVTAYTILNAAGLLDRIAVTATAHLPAGRWYVLPDPAIQPVMAYLTLRGASDSVRVEQAKAPMNFDGFAVRATADLGAAMVSRFAVRGGA
ncbi:hypothetical protein LLG90_04795 [Aromatoleum toluclasticum]|uniref:phage major capsid protein n=1 Tax=Aromatoleum toluclasticum TaxID=92003 RepID=UPI001D1967D8|nr:hypothetical protein [Aromatoleum toluclasticum]MCC4114667.1 hypothetical protein [Aromatoleum toluclasticum]